MLERNMIAVVMSVYINDEYAFFKEAIDSLLDQSYSLYDIYIQFDGDVQTEIRSYISSLNRDNVFVYNRVENKGLAVSLNELLYIVLEKDYRYIARMDSDDVSMKNRFEKQVAFMEANQKLDCVGTWAIEIDRNGKEFCKKRMPITHDECLIFFKKRDCLIHPTVMFRKSFFEKAGLYPENTFFGEDTMMWANGFKNGCCFGNLPEYLLSFRLDVNFFKRRRGLKHAMSILKLRREVNKMLAFGWKANIYAILYSCAKMMPESILNLIYKTLR